MENTEKRNIFITGATDGVGKITAKYLAQKGANVYIHGRSPERIKTTVSEIQETTGNQNVFGYEADFSSFADIRKMVDKILADNITIDVLINNAGMGGGKERKESEDGFELCFQVNYLSTFLLTHLLLPKLQESKKPRIVLVSSLGQYNIDFDNIMLERDYEGLRAYRQSKIAMIMFGFDLAEQLVDKGITVNSLHPGSMLNTKIAGEMFGRHMGEVDEGGVTTSYLAISPNLDDVTGEFFNGKKVARALGQAYDLDARQQLRKLSYEWTGLQEL